MWNAEKKHTPGLDVHGDDGLGSDLGLGSLLLGVGLETLLTDLGSLSVLLLVVAAEQVDIIIILLSLLGSLGGVDGELALLGAVGREGLGSITGKSGELALVGRDVLVPSGGVGVLGSLRSRLQGLEDGNIGLGGTVAEMSSSAYGVITFAEES